MEVVDWQTALRRQLGREQNFGLENLGQDPAFSDFRITNPVSGTHYRVTIRGVAPGHDFCTCLDYATNDLGTCKHIEFTLAKLLAKRGGKAALARRFQPGYSEIWLDYCGERFSDRSGPVIHGLRAQRKRCGSRQITDCHRA